MTDKLALCKTLQHTCVVEVTSVAVKGKQKSDEKRAVTPRFSADLYNRLEQRAIDEGRSIANMLERIVEAFFEQEGKKR